MKTQDAVGYEVLTTVQVETQKDKKCSLKMYILFYFILYFLFVLKTNQASFRKNLNYPFFHFKRIFVIPKEKLLLQRKKKAMKKGNTAFFLKF